MVRPSFKTAQDSFPRQGNRELPITFDFSNASVLFDDLYPEQQASQIETIQSVYIDNSTNAAEFDLIINDTQKIAAQPFTQGVYPVMQQGACRVKALTSQGVKVPCIFSNTAKDYAAWGPVPGVSVVPPLTNRNFDVEPLILGDNVVVAAVGGQQVKLFRGIFSFGGGAVIKFTDGPGGTVLGSFFVTAGGSITFQPSGIPWFVTSAGNALIMNASAAVNGFGTFGFQQN